MNKLIFIAGLLVAAQCAFTGCATVPRTVDIPVAVPCPAPPEFARPHLPIAALRPESQPSEVIRAYAESLELLAGYATQLETVLNGYRK